MKSSGWTATTRTALILVCVLAATGLAGDRPADLSSPPSSRYFSTLVAQPMSICEICHLIACHATLVSPITL